MKPLQPLSPVPAEFVLLLQVLCATCNFAKRLYGYCPHVLERTDLAKRLAPIPLTY